MIITRDGKHRLTHLSIRRQRQMCIRNDRMQTASIDRLRERGRVGMVNACLRIKMVTENRARFALESEKGVGTMVQIRIPHEAS